MPFFAHKCLSAQGGGVDFFQWKLVSCWTYVGTSNKLLAYIPCSRATVACSPFNLHIYKVRLFIYFFVIMMDAEDAHSTCSTAATVRRHVRRHLWVFLNKARRGKLCCRLKTCDFSLWPSSLWLFQPHKQFRPDRCLSTALLSRLRPLRTPGKPDRLSFA